MVTLEVSGYFIPKTFGLHIFIRNCLCKTKFVLNLRLLIRRQRFDLGGRRPLNFGMAHGVTGNTSVFGIEESRFEP